MWLIKSFCRRQEALLSQLLLYFSDFQVVYVLESTTCSVSQLKTKEKKQHVCVYAVNHSKVVYVHRHTKLKFRSMQAISEFILLWHSRILS